MLLNLAILCVAIVVGLSPARHGIPVLAVAAAFVVVQIIIALRGGSAGRPVLDTARLLLAIGAIFWVSLASGDVGSLPLVVMAVPIVVLAAARGPRRGLLVGAVASLGSAAIAAFLLPATGVTPDVKHRAVAVLVTMIVLGIGARQTVASLERAVERARASVARERRRWRQMATVEAIGRVLATSGGTTVALDEVVGLLNERFGYRYVSIYMRDGDLMRLRAQRGYDEVIETFDGTTGVVGRVMRTGEPALVRDVTQDPENRAASPDVGSEVSVPLRSGEAVLGVLNIESGTNEPPLDESDLNTLVVAGDRIAASMALAAEREALLARAALFGRLAAFGSEINVSLDQPTAHSAIVRAVATALETDIVTLILRDPTTGDDRITALHGGDGRYVGVRIPTDTGLVAVAIAERRVVDTPVLLRADFPATVRNAETADALATAVAPLIHENQIVGALAVSRTDLARPYSSLELDALPLIASQVALALSNVSLHARVADAAIRDPLTGLWNRRHLEVASGRLFAARARLDPELRHPVAAIIFDLDHFGQFNKRHGHGVGDAVLREFGRILANRLRSSDIVARFGGEEFVAILDGASATEAQRVADEIRQELETARIPGADGSELRATVSAGCASLGPAVTSLDSLLEIADVALQMAKRGGRNQVVAA